MDFFKSAWRGQEKLWKVFWIYGVLIGIALGIALDLIEKSTGLGGIIFSLIVSLVYSIWLLVSEWRCAFNVKWRGWGYIVRGLVVIWGCILAISVAVIVIGGSSLVLKNREIDALGPKAHGFRVGIEECRKQAKDYIDNGGKDTKDYIQKCMDKNFAEFSPTSSPAAQETPVPSVQQEAVPVQAPAAPVVEDSDAAYKKTCTDSMIAQAQKDNVDPAQYIANNQAYLQQCVQFYVNENSKKMP